MSNLGPKGSNVTGWWLIEWQWQIYSAYCTSFSYYATAQISGNSMKSELDKHSKQPIKHQPYQMNEKKIFSDIASAECLRSNSGSYWGGGQAHGRSRRHPLETRRWTKPLQSLQHHHQPIKRQTQTRWGKPRHSYAKIHKRKTHRNSGCDRATVRELTYCADGDPWAGTPRGWWPSQSPHPDPTNK
jgi:hypothetical protein